MTKRTRAMALLALLICAVAILPTDSVAQQASGAELQRLLFTRLLLDDDAARSQMGARSIAQLPNGAAKQPLTDLVAEHLMRHAETDPALSSGIANVVGWDVNALATDIGRYRPVLLEAQKLLSQPRTLKRIGVAVLQPEPAATEQYSVRHVDLASIKAETERQWTENRRRDRSLFAQLPVGSSVERVLTALGTPDDVSATTTRVARKGRTQMLTLHYAQTGFVLFKIYQPEAGRREWQAYEFVDELFDINAIYIGRQFGMAQALAGLRGARFRDYTIYNARVLIANSEFLPVLEQRLRSTTEPSDKYERDGMLRCLAIIYRYGTPEAKDALRRIEKEATNKHVLNDAGSYATKLELRSKIDPLPAEEEHDGEADEDEA